MAEDPAQYPLIQRSEVDRPAAAVRATAAIGGVPALILAEGDRAARRFLEFFAATIRNPNTRAAYFRAVTRFFAWFEEVSGPQGASLADLEPLHVAAYVELLQGTHAKPTVKQHLASLRMLFDWLVTGHVLAVNPAAPVRSPRHVVTRGKTSVLTPEEARELLDSIDVSTPVGLRDRALIALLTYSFARVGAAVGLRVEDYYPQGKRWWVRLHEKGGKRHDMPVHHNLEAYLDEYLRSAGHAGDKKAPLFRSVRGRNGDLTDRPLTRTDVYRMIRRRVRQAGIATAVSCHTFRATGITAYLSNGGTLENAQVMAAHASPRTTKLYDRTSDEITLDEVERIAI